MQLAFHLKIQPGKKWYTMLSMKNISLKQASDLTEGSGPSDPPPGSTTASFTSYSWAEIQAGSLILITILGV